MDVVTAMPPSLVRYDGGDQKAFGKPACSRTPFAV
jgi:hypothetical protein